MALDMLTASHSGACALVGAECCVCVPDVHHYVSQALQALASETCAVERLPGDPLQERWVSVITEWLWVLAVLGGSACILVACCRSLYCCCRLWAQGSALLAKRPSQNISSCRLCGKEPRRGRL